MANQNVIDELIVQLRLDAEPYREAERRTERETDRTFRKQQQRARQTDRSNKDQQARLKSLAGGVAAFAKGVTAAVSVVTGLGAAVTATLGGFLNFETSLRRQAVGTALSNRQMQAWGATARRMGADAEAGAAAVAQLAKERQGLHLGVPAPTLQALSRFGINVQSNQSIEDILSSAQQAYRGGSSAQRQQMENVLSASGASADLIVMIKSEVDARGAYARSFSQAADENAAASAKLADAFETIKSNGIKVAGTLLDVLEPAIASGGEKLAALALELDNFAKDVKDAGGGVNGFQAALDKNVPWLGYLFEGFRMLGDVLGDAWQGLKNLVNWLPTGGRGVRDFLNRSRNPFGTQPLGDAIQSAAGRARSAIFGDSTGGGAGIVGNAVLRYGEWWDRVTAGPAALPRSVENDPAAARGAVSANAQSIMNTLTTQYGLSAAQAAAVVANLQGESGLRAGAVNNAGGGTGARGLAQWRGARTDAFRKRYGKLPNEASVAEQLEFMMTDPYERSLMNKAFASGGSAEQLGVSFSKIFEAHGNVAEDARRGRAAAQLAGGATSSVNIQNMTVQSNNAGEFVNGLQRLDSTQPYNTVVR